MKTKRNMFIRIILLMVCLLVGTTTAMANQATSANLGAFGNFEVATDMSYGGTSATASCKFEFGSTFRADWITTSATANNSKKITISSYWEAKGGATKTENASGTLSAYLLAKGKVSYATNAINVKVGITCSNGQLREHTWYGNR